MFTYVLEPTEAGPSVVAHMHAQWVYTIMHIEPSSRVDNTGKACLTPLQLLNCSCRTKDIGESGPRPLYPEVASSS